MSRIRDFGITVGTLPTGARNKISDVPGVTVGHCTIDTQEYKTGVSVVQPCEKNPFLYKLPAAAFVLNGFGKSLGLVQVEELGQLESPIFLTNTLNVGKVHDAAVGYLIERCQADGAALRSANPVVCECNDGSLSRITGRPVEESHVGEAIAAATADFQEGDVGAGKGMICHDLKGGVGSASRLMEADGQVFTLGVLALTNHGSLRDLTIGGEHIGPALAEKLSARHTPDVGSCILIMATDLPLDSRQLGRVLRRGSVGLARLGSYIGHGSGEVFLGFSTANAWDSRSGGALRQTVSFAENKLDLPFRAMAECAEEAVLNALTAAHTVTGYTGRTVYGLTEVWGPNPPSTP
jgi:D-aminopeptidase